MRVCALLEMDASDGIDADEMEQLRELISADEARAIRGHLETIKACDPSVGSGAFAVGLLQEFVNLWILCETRERAKDPREVEDPNYLYHIKRKFIESAIYGVDIQPQAIEICKLRLWLSLAVDFQLAADPRHSSLDKFRYAISKIEPLPNLAYKIRRGDSLLDQIHGQDFLLDKVKADAQITDAYHRIEKEQQNFFNAQHPDKKRNMRRRVLDERLRLAERYLKRMKEQVATYQTTMFGETEKQTAARKQREEQLAKLEAAEHALKRAQRKFNPLKAQSRVTAADEVILDELEAGSDKDMTFAWRLDFPEVFQRKEREGFDLVVGNPPFVTARNPEKRELYRARWKEVCHGNYLLVTPFFARSFGILASGGQLGFIVSNAFAKREFGKPLVENFFPTVELEKVVDCSGLMFPGHGTPTCLVFGKPKARTIQFGKQGNKETGKQGIDGTVRVTAILPGGGDLRTRPEDSTLWRDIVEHHDSPGYSDARIVISDVVRGDMAKWPWNFDVSTKPTRQIIESGNEQLLQYLASPIGYVCITKGDEFFFHPQNFIRRLSPKGSYIMPLSIGDTIRDWSREEVYALFPYNPRTLEIEKLGKLPYADFFKLFREPMSERITFGKPQSERGEWYEYAMMSPERVRKEFIISMPEIATHNHALVLTKPFLASQTAPVSCLASEFLDDNHLFAGVLNSSAALFWLKQISFNKNAGEAEERDRFVYAGGKVQQLPIPRAILEQGELRKHLTALSRACWERGQILPSLAMKKLFEQNGEAYHAWNSSLAGYIAPHELIKAFDSAEDLLEMKQRVIAERERLRREMIALQEEMDWVVYAAYGVVKDEGGRMKDEKISLDPLSLGERPFELKRANAPIPEAWDAERRALWQARLNEIETNEHVRRIEQPMYKRRWVPPAYDKEFSKAFEWWLLEKAEWHLEHKAKGGPLALETWAHALYQDARVRAAASVIQPDGMSFPAFVQLFKNIVNDAAVPEEIPAAIPWEKVEAEFGKVPQKVKAIRGKLNVPRERFRLREKGVYVWAGKG